MRPRIGLAISGGGSKGAFNVGALRAIDAGLSAFPYPVISGTSTGSLIGTLLTTNEFTKLVKIYSTIKTDQIVTPNHPLVAKLLGVEAVLFASAVLGGQSIWDTTPLENTIKNNVDWAKVKRNADKTLLIYSTVDLRSGKTVTFNNRDHSEGTLAKAMLASSSMPVFTPPVRLKRGQLHEELVDGGVTEFLPLRAVFRSGVKLDHIIAISTSPLTPRMVDSDFQDIVEILGRTVDLFGSEVGKNDYHGALEFNTILKMIENAEAAGVSRNRILKGIPPNVRTRLKDKRYVPITFIGPNKHIEMEPLSFEPAAMKKLMKQGFDAAKKVVPKIARSLTA